MQSNFSSQRIPTDKEIEVRRQKEEGFIHSMVGCVEVGVSAWTANARALNFTRMEYAAMSMRFEQLLPIARIADRMGMSWDGVDFLIMTTVDRIQRTLRKLRDLNSSMQLSASSNHFVPLNSELQEVNL